MYTLFSKVDSSADLLPSSCYWSLQESNEYIWLCIMAIEPIFCYEHITVRGSSAHADVEGVKVMIQRNILNWYQISPVKMYNI